MARTPSHRLRALASCSAMADRLEASPGAMVTCPEATELEGRERSVSLSIPSGQLVKPQVNDHRSPHVSCSASLDIMGIARHTSGPHRKTIMRASDSHMVQGSTLPDLIMQSSHTRRSTEHTGSAVHRDRKKAVITAIIT